MCRAPFPASQSATKRPSAPCPPVTRYVPSGRIRCEPEDPRALVLIRRYQSEVAIRIVPVDGGLCLSKSLGIPGRIRIVFSSYISPIPFLSRPSSRPWHTTIFCSALMPRTVPRRRPVFARGALRRRDGDRGCRAVKHLLTSVVQEICTLRSAGARARATAPGHPVCGQ